MILWFVDSSVLLAREDADDSNHEDARRLLEGADQVATLDLAFYEVTNVAIRSWRDHSAARRLGARVPPADDGGLVHADAALLLSAATIAEEHGISVYAAAYVAAARASKGQLVSCDVRDLVSRGSRVSLGTRSRPRLAPRLAFSSAGGVCHASYVRFGRSAQGVARSVGAVARPGGEPGILRRRRHPVCVHGSLRAGAFGGNLGSSLDAEVEGGS